MEHDLHKTQSEPWQVAAARFCVANSENGFTVAELQDYIKANYEVDDFQINEFFEEEIRQPSGRQFSRPWRSNNRGSGVWTPPISLLSTLTNYDALQEARSSSKKAFYIAIGSLGVAIIVGVAQIWLLLK